MKKNYALGLLLLAAMLLFLHSCRNDYLQDQAESYSNASKFQLTSRRISLNEAKHKAKLIPELNKAEAKIKAKVISNINGKVISYGNGVSIDTDDVIYIEKGPDIHSYTFHINRENASEDAPVENLLLSPLPDGTYREFLVSYYLFPLPKSRS
ncbi:hypothetical protein JI747_017695 [Chryseobacterium sp. RG1]|uniref:Uncharacterized protein n=1 Tax=Chryseobacterium tagetis TaxID=2801334 RepID=A0ABS8A692_9FLAO|nr:hypothetical protein [Chryseobacterium tagetis]MCA6069003.1 hypothetical protein [Chryseobacterium tagetis]